METFEEEPFKPGTVADLLLGRSHFNEIDWLQLGSWLQLGDCFVASFSPRLFPVVLLHFTMDERYVKNDLDKSWVLEGFFCVWLSFVC
ncbi:hypothetical protein CEXT_2791 [Caerostris extrusa]|uniref:Uncharacterized protein n=1 Tax=Caerostris extrusa TaxID=172846 RepID=A0AAV4R2I1_CAEEX|nr:hypothetical protein CEXT_2791 [Caerostris extrusa]